MAEKSGQRQGVGKLAGQQQAKPKFQLSAMFKSKNTCNKAQNYMPYTKAEVDAKALVGYGVHEVNARYTKDLAITKETVNNRYTQDLARTKQIITKLPKKDLVAPKEIDPQLKLTGRIRTQNFFESIQKSLTGSTQEKPKQKVKTEFIPRQQEISRNHPSFPKIFLEGPYNLQRPYSDSSYRFITQPGVKALFENYEKAHDINEVDWGYQDLFAQFGAIEHINSHLTLLSENDPSTKTSSEDETYVKVDDYDASYIKTPYQEANAKDLNNPYGLMIAAEGPTADTNNSFWKMVMQENVTKVFSLCDENSTGCKYFPKSKDYPMYRKDDDIDYMIFLGDAKVGPNHTKRHLEIHMKQKKSSQRNKKEERVVYKVEHIQIKSWNGRSIRSSDAQADFVSLVESEAVDFLIEQQKKKVPEKLAVHCVDGRDRTGTMMALVNSIISLKEQKDNKLSLFSIVRRLREQRSRMLGDKNQYKFVYELIKKWQKMQDNKEQALAEMA